MSKAEGWVNSSQVWGHPTWQKGTGSYYNMTYLVEILFQNIRENLQIHVFPISPF